MGPVFYKLNFGEGGCLLTLPGLTLQHSAHVCSEAESTWWPPSLKFISNDAFNPNIL